MDRPKIRAASPGPKRLRVTDVTMLALGLLSIESLGRKPMKVPMRPNSINR